VLISSGYGQGSGRVSLKRDDKGVWQTEEAWRTNRMKAKFTNLIEVGGFIYGIDDGIFACLDPQADGKLRWRDGRVGHGQVLLVGSVFLITAEDGSVVLATPNPDEWRELARIRVLSDKTWNPPALAGNYLLVRNDREAVCLRIPVKVPES
jgi:outer membrane protein assembly factor BamB